MKNTNRLGEITESVITKNEIELRSGLQGISIMNNIPGVYLSRQSVNYLSTSVRGFDEIESDNAMMINGINIGNWRSADMIQLEEVTEQIVIVKGINTTTSSNSVNFVTHRHNFDDKVIGIKHEYGSGDTYKTTIKYGDNFGNLSLYGCLVDKTSNGIIDGTWSESMAYYLSTDYKLNDKQNLSLTVLGSPLRYGLGFGENISSYSTKLANQLSEIDGYEPNNGIEQGIKFNRYVADISPSNMGKQYWKMYGNKKLKNRHDIKSLNERENFKHAPLVNIGHNIDLSDIMGLNTQLYWLGARGGARARAALEISVQMGVS